MAGMILWLLASLVVLALGLLIAFAGGMSDAPAAGARAQTQGCVTMIFGLVSLVACIIVWVL